MENQDKIYEQFKKASENIGPAPFQSMDKVWSRVEEKLDKKVLAKQGSLWKKIAIAASILLVFTLTYQIIKPEPTIIIPKNEVVTNAPKLPEMKAKKQIADAEKPSPIIKKEAKKILEQQLTKPQSVAARDEETVEGIAATNNSEANESDNVVYKSKEAPARSLKNNRFQNGKVFESVGVHRKDSDYGYSQSDNKTTEAQITGNAQAPLVVIDGKAITGKEARKINLVSDGVAKMDANGDQEVVILKEPLYIINGHYYSEEELFGPNPTSPYAPLNQQEIESVLVLQGEKAVTNYGKRGEKGVVVITTKDRKPVTASKEKTK